MGRSDADPECRDCGHVRSNGGAAGDRRCQSVSGAGVPPGPRTIETLPQSVVALIAAREDLSELPGIGKNLAGKIAKIVSSGNSRCFNH
jgi:hypothetical protein